MVTVGLSLISPVRRGFCRFAGMSRLVTMVASGGRVCELKYDDQSPGSSPGRAWPACLLVPAWFLLDRSYAADQQRATQGLRVQYAIRNLCSSLDPSP